MSLVSVQNLLARLYTDPELREDFFADPAQIAREFHLSAAEVAETSRMAEPQVRNFAGSLIQKRLNEARKKLSFTSQALGQEFDRLFHQFAQKGQCKRSKKPLEDCCHFFEFLVSVVRREGVKPWILDLMRYEIVQMRAGYSKFGFKVYFSRYGIRNLMIEIMESTGRSVEARRRITVGLWVREPRSKKMWHILY